MSISKTCLAILVGTIIASVEIEFTTSAESNCDDNSKLQYVAGKSYGYNIHLVTYDTHSHHHGKSHHHPHHTFKGPKHETPKTKGKITTQGSVVLTALENCEYVLTLNKVKQEIQVDREFSKIPITHREHQVPRTSVKFTFKNGEVSGLQGAENGRAPWTDNIIRGILTMIQNKAMSNSDGEPEEREVNIKGDCVAKVYIPKDGEYQKTIHAGQCSEAIMSPLVEGVSYTAPVYSPVAGLRHLNSHIRCVQQVQKGLLSHVNCTENDEVMMTHQRMDTLSSLKALTNESGLEASKVGGATSEEISGLSQAMSIIYDMSQNILAEGPNFVQTIANLAKKIYTDRDANKAEEYQRLKEMLGSVKDFEQLEKALESVSGGDTLQAQFVKNIIREAATEIGSEAAIVYLAKLVNNKVLEWGSMISFYTKLPYSRHPTVKGLGALVGNLEGAWANYQNDTFISFHFGEKKRIRKMMLGTSAYAYQFCRRNANCGGVTQYQELVNQISQFCDSKQPEISPACLHALGNMEHLPQKTVDVLKNILLSTGELLTGQNKKITAFDAFRRDPCQAELKTLARENMENTQNSQEMRTVAYLAVARCPTEEDVTAIDKILENEFDTPLSSFIASHVYNIMDSQSPSKAYLQSTVLGQIGIPTNVPTAHNSTGASRFIEYSTFRPESNLGFSADGHILYKDDGSHKPMFMHLNLTVDFLGKSYNKLQVGISKRYFPKVEKFNFLLKKHRGIKWISQTMIPALFSVDSYYRVYGTTISMGVDIFDTLKPQEFFDRFEDKATGLMRLDLVKPFTLWEKEVIFPTIAGTPITMSAQGSYLPILSLNHTGDPNGLGLFDLFSKWDEKSGQFHHKSRLDGTFFAKWSLAAGKGTPVSMAYNLEATVRCNHSIGYESLKNLSTSWVKRVEFPDHVLWSKRITLARTFTMESGTDQVTKWPVFGDMKPHTPRKLFQFGGMGLRFTADLLKRHHHLDSDIIVMVEKTDDQFTGYSLDIENKPNGTSKSFDVTMRAEGLQDSLRFKFYKDKISVDALQNEGDRPKSEYTVETEYTSASNAPMGVRISYASVGFPKSDMNVRSSIPELEVSSMLSVVSLGILTRSSYSFKVESWTHNAQIPLLDWSSTNSKDVVQVTLKFQGPLTQCVGTISGQVSLPSGSNEITGQDSAQQSGTVVNAEFTQESQSAGKNKVTLDFASGNGDTKLNTSATIKGKSYHLTQHLPFIPAERTEDASGNTVTWVYSRKYNAHYHDSSKIEFFLTAGADDNLQQKSALYNQSIRLSGSLPQPIVLENSFYQDRDLTLTDLLGDGVLRTVINSYAGYADEKGPHAKFNYDQNITLSEVTDTNTAYCNGDKRYNQEGKLHCITTSASSQSVISDKMEVKSSFSNDYKYKTEFSIIGSHHHPNIKGDLTYVMETTEEKPGLKITDSTTLNWENLEKGGKKGSYQSNTETDLEKRTITHNSTAKYSGGPHGEMQWTTKLDANWPENLLKGDIKAKIVHTCPRKKTATIDILNQARLSEPTGEQFNNTLTVLVDVVGMTREFTPKKQFTWVITSDSSSSEEEKKKYDYRVKSASDMKLEMLDGQKATEVFHLKDGGLIMKTIGKESWTLNGNGNVFVHGREQSAWDWDMALNVAEKCSGETTCKTLVATDNIPADSAKTTFNWRGDGWFETGQQPAWRNNTWSSRYSSEMAIVDQLLFSEQVTFLLEKVDEATGKVMFTVDVAGNKDVKFKDFLHFSKHQNATIKVDNTTTTFVKDVTVNGPHITFFLRSGNDNVDEDSFVIDFAAGIYEEKHQHKFNLRSGSKHNRHHHAQVTNGTIDHKQQHGRPHHMIRNMIPVTNFNFTVSK